MTRATTIVLLVCLLFGCETARNIENPDLKSFVRLIGKEGDQTARDILVLSDGSMILLGDSRSSILGQQLYVVRTSAEGFVLWERFLGQVDASSGAIRDLYVDEAKDLELLNSTEFVILAMQEDAGNRDYVVRLMTVDGILTDSIVGGVPGHTEEAFTITKTSNSLIVSGYTTDVLPTIPPSANPADGFFARYNQDLSPYTATPWNSRHGFGAGAFDVAVRTIEEGTSFLVIGHTNGPDPGDAVLDYNTFVWSLGTGGDPQNQFLIGNAFIAGSTLGADETVTSVSVAPDGTGYIVSGYSVVQSSNFQTMFNIKLRADLATVPPTQPGTGLDNTEALFFSDPKTDADADTEISLALHGANYPLPDGDFLVVGSRGSTGNEDIYLKRLNNGLNSVWIAPPFFLFGGLNNDFPGAVAESTLDGRIILLGTMRVGGSEINGQQKMLLMKLSPSGKLGE